MQKIIYEDNDTPKEFCGLFGIFGHKQASWLTYLGLFAQQHRGQEACGIVVSNKGNLSVYKHMGLVSDVFTPEVLDKLKGAAAVGHVRYSTTGSSVLKNAQPLLIDYAKGAICIAHNGNLVNSLELSRELEEKGSIFQTTTDSEIIIHLMARAKSRDLLESLVFALERVKGAYSLVMMDSSKMIGVRDPLGFRPLVLGKLGSAYCLASETCAFDLVGAKYIREIEPGEIVFIDVNGIKSIKPKSLQLKGKHSFCTFEHVYFSRPDSVIFGETVHTVRRKLGGQLAREHPVKADYVIPVPDSGFSAAMGYSHESGIPLEMGIIRNHYVGRTFRQARHDAYLACMQLRPGNRGIATDVCVPVSRLADCIAQTNADIAKASMPIALFGHVGDGNFHLVILVDAKNQHDLDEAEAINQRVVMRALAMGGTSTGEHGVGIGKLDFLDAEHGDAVSVMRAIKHALDPDNLFNPGKVVRL